MDSSKRSNLSKQVLLTYGIVAVLLIALGTLSYFSFRSVEQQTGTLARNTTPLILASTIHETNGLQNISLLERLNAREPDVQNRYERELDARSRRMTELLERLQTYIVTEQGHELYTQASIARDAYRAARHEVLAFDREGDHDRARAHYDRVFQPAMLEFQDRLNALINYHHDTALEAEEQAVAAIGSGRLGINLLIAVGLVVMAVLSFIILGVVRRLHEDQARLSREVTERRRAEGELRELTTELERKVDARTADIEQARARLERELEERRLIEAELAKRLDELHLTNSELEQFAYIASHDLQEPLRKIQAFGDRLRRRFGENLPPQGLDYLDRMEGAAGRMSVLIADLLELSRVTTHARPFDPVDLKQVATDVVSDLDNQIEREGGRVELGDLPTIDADPSQMRQLFQNLISNALKFRAPGVPPVVKVHARPLRGDELDLEAFATGADAGEKSGDNTRSAGDAHGAFHGTSGARRLNGKRRGRLRDELYWQITVEDNGIGFDEKYLEKIFVVFQRLHGRKHYPGSGIGLALCRKIVGRHSGTLTAHSTPGEGAQFIITLPAVQRRPAPGQDIERLAPPDAPPPAHP